LATNAPIEIVSERWYSPELQLVVMTRHSDPRTGETTYKLTNLNRPNRRVTFRSAVRLHSQGGPQVGPKFAPVPRMKKPANPE
jgi:hypothetical protein